MHRQSLGSPASASAAATAAKLHANANANGVFVKETSSSSPQLLKKKPANDDDEKQNKKPHKTTPSGLQHPEKLIHLIPILTLLCIFILYLNSHDPSQNDLAQFNGFKILSKPTDSTNIDKIQGVLEIGNGEVLAIRSARNLQGVDKGGNSKYRINRKIGDF